MKPWQETDGYAVHEFACRSSHIDQCSYYVGGDTPNKWATKARQRWEEYADHLLEGLALRRGRGRHEVAK